MTMWARGESDSGSPLCERGVLPLDYRPFLNLKLVNIILNISCLFYIDHMKFYTGNGDKGTTSLIDYGNVPKDDPLLAAIGSVDELNSSIGIALFYIHDEKVRKELDNIQNDLFILGADLACTLTKNKVKSFGPELVERLEKEIDDLAEVVGELRKFVLPRGGEGAVHLQFSRAIARRAERDIVSASRKYKVNSEIIRYINRLSSYLFVAALYLNKIEGIEESHPSY